MIRTIFLISSLLATFILNAQTIDIENSIVNFAISNMKWKTVEGNFSGMKGQLAFDESDLQNSSFNVCIDAATVNTENEKRDNHLKNEDFFEVNAYPEICFESTSIEKKGDAYITKGKLSMHGVTKNVEIEFTYSQNTFKGNLTINRFDFNLGEDTNTFLVGEEVELEIICKTR